MNKALFIRVSTLIVLIGLMLTIGEYADNLYRGLMTAIGGWQVGVWAADLGNYLVRKFNAEK